MIYVTPAAHFTFCTFKSFMAHMSSAWKQGREEVVGVLCCCYSHTKQQLPLWVQPASILQQKQTGNTPSSILSCPPPPPLPPPLSSLVLTPHCTQVPAAERYNTKNHALWEALRTAGYQPHLSSPHSSIPLLLYFPLLLRLILKAQHSLHACTVEREREKKW